jgi:hypothetical protein
MQNGQRFRLTREAMAIAQRNSRNVAITIPEGAIIEVMGGPFNGTRLMEVRYNDEMIMMFTDDMKTHTELVKEHNAQSTTLMLRDDKFVYGRWGAVLGFDYRFNDGPHLSGVG